MVIIGIHMYSKGIFYGGWSPIAKTSVGCTISQAFEGGQDHPQKESKVVLATPGVFGIGHTTPVVPPEPTAKGFRGGI